MLPELALDRLKKACSIREYCQFDIEQKLQNWGVDFITSQNIISELISENFLNEERYAKSFTNDKVNLSYWGKHKIIQNLRAKRVSQYNINIAISSIDEARYAQVIEHVFIVKMKVLKQSYKRLTLNQKISTFMLSRGFSYDEFKDLLSK